MGAYAPDKRFPPCRFHRRKKRLLSGFEEFPAESRSHEGDRGGFAPQDLARRRHAHGARIADDGVDAAGVAERAVHGDDRTMQPERVDDVVERPEVDDEAVVNVEFVRRHDALAEGTDVNDSLDNPSRLGGIVAESLQLAPVRRRFRDKRGQNHSALARAAGRAYSFLRGLARDDSHFLLFPDVASRIIHSARSSWRSRRASSSRRRSR